MNDSGTVAFLSDLRLDDLSAAVNSSGQVAIRVTLLGNSTTPVTVSDDTAICTTATGLTLVARENDAAPGNNGQFGHVTGDPLINDAGEIEFPPPPLPKTAIAYGPFLI